MRMIAALRLPYNGSCIAPCCVLHDTVQCRDIKGRHGVSPAAGLHQANQGFKRMVDALSSPTIPLKTKPSSLEFGQ